jgi:hypothetical protein
MAPRPWRPAAELDAALDRGDLRYAIALADELRETRGRPVALDTATRFLPLIARESPREYDAYALRWLVRWLSEAGAATIERAAAVTSLLAALPREAGALERLRALLGAGPDAQGGARADGGASEQDAGAPAARQDAGRSEISTRSR